MRCDRDRSARALLAAVASRFVGVRAGVDVGFADASFSSALRAAHAGVWMTVETDARMREVTAGALDPKTVLCLGTGGEMPFEDRQFEVVVLSASLFEGHRERLNFLVRETHRILQGGGCLFFTVSEASSSAAGWTQRAIYELLRDGFDVVGLKRPAWWRFGMSGRTMTVCARRKNWRNRGTLMVMGREMAVSAAMLSPRERQRI